MTPKPMTDLEKANYNKYIKPGYKNLRLIRRRKLDEFNSSIANTNEHECAKLCKFLDLRREGHRVITEAVDCATQLRRDLVDVTDGEVWEFETNPKRAARHPKGINVVMVEK